MKWSKVMVVLLPLGMVGSLLYGCSTKDRPLGAGGEGSVTPNSETCTEEGTQRDCHQMVSIQDGVKSCLHATQICSGGRWGACGAAGGTIEATNVGIGMESLAPPTKEELEERAGQLKLLTHEGGSPDAAACANPCDPACEGYDIDAGVALDASADVNSVVGLPSTPPGFQDKLLRDKANSWGSDCERWDTGNNMTGWVHSACQVDYYCARHTSGPNVGNCVQFTEGPNETHAGKNNATNAGGVVCADAFPDLTISNPCLLGGAAIIPVCNRGAAAIPAGTAIKVSEENSTLTTPTAPTLKATPAAGAEMAACPTYSSNVCSVTLTAPLNPGFCVRFNGSTNCASALNGNKSLYVNSDKSIRECVIQPKVLGPPISQHGPTAEQVQQYGCANNYSAFNFSQLPNCTPTFLPRTITETFAAQCQPGQIVQWGKLAWSAVTPSTSEILFEVRTRTNSTDGAVGPWSPWVQGGLAKQLVTPVDPPNCPMAGPLPCPKDLYVPLGLPAANQEQLEIRITLRPDLTGLIPPVLNNYKVAYSCKDYE